MEYLLYIFAVISALCVALPVHEWAHAYVAYKQGDPTAKISGRMTLAPFAHFDPLGFVCLMLFHFGWAKPVPIDSRNLLHGKRSEVLVSVAGVCANLVSGTFFILVSCLLKRFVPTYADSWGIYGQALSLFLSLVIDMNFILAFFNILPIYPLDGFRVIEVFSKPSNGFVNFMKRYSYLILLLLIIFTYFLDYYFAYTALPLRDGITWVFNKLFSLF